MRNRLYFIAVLWALGVVLVLAGLFLTIGAPGRLGRIAARLEEKRGYFEELRQLEQKIAPYLDAKAMIKGFEETEPVPLEDIAAQVVETDENPQVRSVGSKEIDDWALIRKEVALNDLPVSEIFAAIAAAEISGFRAGELYRPSWALVRCAISSPGARSGWGRASLVFETIVRK